MAPALLLAFMAKIFRFIKGILNFLAVFLC